MDSDLVAVFSRTKGLDPPRSWKSDSLKLLRDNLTLVGQDFFQVNGDVHIFTTAVCWIPIRELVR